MTPLIEFPFENVLLVVLLLSWAITSIFWCMEMGRALERVAPDRREMTPVNVWLVFVPFFGLYWQFAVTAAVAHGIAGEYLRRHIIPREERPGFSSGLTACILFCCGLIPVLGVLISIFSNIPRLVHLAKIRGYVKELDNIMRAEMNYVPPPPPPVEWTTPEDVQRKTMAEDPRRYMPPQSEEETRNRWGKKD